MAEWFFLHLLSRFCSESLKIAYLQFKVHFYALKIFQEESFQDLTLASIFKACASSTHYLFFYSKCVEIINFVLKNKVLAAV